MLYVPSIAVYNAYDDDYGGQYDNDCETNEDDDYDQYPDVTVCNDGGEKWP
jgi:hypothetical protein